MKYLILGAGPSGLSFAHTLKMNQENSFLILEREREAGGLCRSVDVDGAPFDIGGGHFLDVRRPQVNAFLFRFMPEEEWIKFNRDSRIFINGTMIDYPIEANIWQMEIDEQVEYLKSIASAGCTLGSKMPEKFVEWIYWKLGDRIAEDYMIPYNQKIFGDDINLLGTYWMEKLPNISFEDALRSCLTRKTEFLKRGGVPAHIQFYYPLKYGYGEVWSRMAESLEKQIEYQKQVISIDFNQNKVCTFDGDSYYADYIITTIPWTEFSEILGMPKDIQNSISELKFNSIQTEYFMENLNTNAQWVYYPDPELSYHRILVRHNFCSNSRGYWTETNVSRVNKVTNNFCYKNQYAYPMNTIQKPAIMKKLLGWAASKNVFGLGRWGEWQHYNSDVVVALAMEHARNLITKGYWE